MTLDDVVRFYISKDKHSVLVLPRHHGKPYVKKILQEFQKQIKEQSAAGDADK